MNDYDVIIIGAGLSGIGAAVHLQRECPKKTFAVLEARDSIGGTWDLFRYPGIRSDSDMFTLGYVFKPWTESKAIADGPSILRYVRETAAEHGIKPLFNHKVSSANWNGTHWVLQVGEKTFTARFVFACAGYYNYDAGYTPQLAGVERFKGTVVHPQHWPQDLDYSGKRIVVIGSGATAVTLVPELSKRAAHVVMLQRSPTYVLTRPAVDGVANWLRGHLPAQTAYALSRWKNILVAMAFYGVSKALPGAMKKIIRAGVVKEVGPDFDVDKHFTPTYDPWDQRVCLVPDGDLFVALREKRASIVTDHIDTITETGIRLRSGEELSADIIVTATGLCVQFLGGAAVSVNDKPVEPTQTMTYKGLMLSDVPNFAFAVGYTNASWTLKCDLASEYVCRLLNHMDANGFSVAVPRFHASLTDTLPLIDFSSGYVQRAQHMLPRQGKELPWRLYQNYIRDLAMFRHQGIADDAMEFIS